VGAAKVYGQVNATYQSSASSDLRTANAFSGWAGCRPFARSTCRWARMGQVLARNLRFQRFDERGQLSRFVACGVCGQRPYIVPTTPRTIGLRAGAKF
jgi:hypothetical protein